jgi:serine/threonine protein kinase
MFCLLFIICDIVKDPSKRPTAVDLVQNSIFSHLRIRKEISIFFDKKIKSEMVILETKLGKKIAELEQRISILEGKKYSEPTISNVPTSTTDSSYSMNIISTSSSENKILPSHSSELAESSEHPKILNYIHIPSKGCIVRGDHNLDITITENSMMTLFLFCIFCEIFCLFNLSLVFLIK